MKRMMILLLTLTVTGCIELPIRPEPDAKFMKPAKPAPDAKEPTLPPMAEAPPVAPDQVNDANAPKVLEALREELDRAATQPKP